MNRTQEKKNPARQEMFHRSIIKFSKPEDEGEKENYKEVICRERNNLLLLIISFFVSINQAIN